MTANGLALRHPAVWLSTWFGLGLVPRVGGVLAPLSGLPVAWALLAIGGSYGGGLVFLAATLLFWLGFWAAAVRVRATGRARPEIVVDRVVGLWLPLMFVRPDQIWQFVVAPLLYFGALHLRPWPARWVDEHLPGAFGIMLDGFIAGAYAALATYLIVHVAEHPYVAGLVHGAL